MGADVGDVRHPRLVGHFHRELLLQHIGGSHRRCPAPRVGTPAVTPLGLQAFLLEQLGHPVFAALLTQVTHVQGELAVTVNPTAFQPGVLEQAQQPAVVLGAGTFRLCLPGVVPAGVQPQDTAHT